MDITYKNEIWNKIGEQLEMDGKLINFTYKLFFLIRILFQNIFVGDVTVLRLICVNRP